MKFNFKKVFSLKKKEKKEPPSITVRAARDWKVMLVTFLVVIVAITSANVFIFYKFIKEGNLFRKEGATDSKQSLDKRGLSQMLENMDKRAQDMKKLEENQPTFIDPSR